MMNVSEAPSSMPKIKPSRWAEETGWKHRVDPEYGGSYSSETYVNFLTTRYYVPPLWEPQIQHRVMSIVLYVRFQIALVRTGQQILYHLYIMYTT
jgi:hypothetical protein